MPAIRLYDRFAPAYDAATRFYAWWESGADATRRKAYLDRLQLPTRGSLPETFRKPEQAEI